MSARYSVGIDLGTTNCVVAYAPLTDPSAADGDAPSIRLLPIPQWVGAGQTESRTSLPSFLYLPRDGEVDSLRSELVADPQNGIAGYFARTQSADNPQRVVVAAKSWLCHGKVGRTDAVLPWQSPPEVKKVSALDCTRRFLSHLVAAWHDAHADAPLADQQVVLTVPASFDPVARELTRQAAIDAGLPNDFVLLEEPQAAVYHWLASHSNDWRTELSAGDVMLVVDVGGGTTDLTLVTVDEADGELNLKRLAVGNHLLLGGDNMDLAMAHLVGTRLAEQGHDLDPWQSVSLWHACRDAKEQLLTTDGPAEQTISVLGRGSSLIGNTISTQLSADEAKDLIIEGFFPVCESTDRPARQAVSGFQDIGLPYEADPAITKQVAAFLADHADKTNGLTHLLFNGGVFRSHPLRDRMRSVIAGWCPAPPTVLSESGAGDRTQEAETDSNSASESATALDSAVALGAAYYGWSKQSGGIRIRGGTARSYYIGIETAGLAIPGAPRPMRAVCVAPQGMEEGTEAAVPGGEVGMVVGQPARFRFFSSTMRRDDEVGRTLDRWNDEELVEGQPIELTLTSESAGDDAFVPVRFVSRVTELGMFELWCHATRSDEQWKMEFNIRESQ
ncbi:Chaperone protein DnaK [Rubripirellula lacrimiformis]|uniref:Chaperone protein DnaK n=1 Tax=Rubripirellula lacrimiformis TaxID=1930273 RepID=A0A517NDU1_9BACT|nr:Hsp70 family protein [Rubripirellula lacrimiformis]QDT05300.1 Chaperone protein DnaK [Rubripirellula lacrimiformis]